MNAVVPLCSPSTWQNLPKPSSFKRAQVAKYALSAIAVTGTAFAVIQSGRLSVAALPAYCFAESIANYRFDRLLGPARRYPQWLETTVQALVTHAVAAGRIAMFASACSALIFGKKELLRSLFYGATALNFGFQLVNSTREVADFHEGEGSPFHALFTDYCRKNFLASSSETIHSEENRGRLIASISQWLVGRESIERELPFCRRIAGRMALRLAADQLNQLSRGGAYLSSLNTSVLIEAVLLDPQGWIERLQGSPLGHTSGLEGLKDKVEQFDPNGERAVEQFVAIRKELGDALKKSSSSAVMQRSVALAFLRSSPGEEPRELRMWHNEKDLSDVREILSHSFSNAEVYSVHNSVSSFRQEKREFHLLQDKLQQKKPQSLQEDYEEFEFPGQSTTAVHNGSQLSLQFDVLKNWVKEKFPDLEESWHNDIDPQDVIAALWLGRSNEGKVTLRTQLGGTGTERSDYINSLKQHLRSVESRCELSTFDNLLHYTHFQHARLAAFYKVMAPLKALHTGPFIGKQLDASYPIDDLILEVYNWNWHQVLNETIQVDSPERPLQSLEDRKLFQESCEKALTAFLHSQHIGDWTSLEQYLSEKLGKPWEGALRERKFSVGKPVGYQAFQKKGKEKPSIQPLNSRLCTQLSRGASKLLYAVDKVASGALVLFGVYSLLQSRLTLEGIAAAVVYRLCALPDLQSLAQHEARQLYLPTVLESAQDRNRNFAYQRIRFERLSRLFMVVLSGFALPPNPFNYLHPSFLAGSTNGAPPMRILASF